MVKVSYRSDGGEDQVVEVREGDSLMTGAVFAGVPGIEGLCGGSISCGTCHLHVEPSWLEAVGAPGPSEQELLQALDKSAFNSRLGCQIIAKSALDGLIVTVAT